MALGDETRHYPVGFLLQGLTMDSNHISAWPRAPLSVTIAGAARRSAKAIAALFGLALAAMSLLGSPAQAQTRPQTTAAAKSGPSAGRLSKFEARRIRHACRSRANEGKLSGAERERFLTSCYFGRVARRPFKRECTQLGLSKGLDKNALAVFVRECSKERAHQKN
jgi:hypothetical protein